MGKKAFRDTAKVPLPALEPVPAAEAPSENAAPQTRRFRSRFTAVRLSPEAATRQGRAATLAWEALRDRDAMIAFLNTHDMALGGRPIDLAVESEAGLAAVAARLAGQPAAASNN